MTAVPKTNAIPEPTATEASYPNINSAGVTKNEPPIPKKPKRMPTTSPKPTNSAIISGDAPKISRLLTSTGVTPDQQVQQPRSDQFFDPPIPHVEDDRLDEDRPDDESRLWVPRRHR